MTHRLALMAPLLGMLSGACAASDDTAAYTLYRTSAGVRGDAARIHVATFDAEAGGRYNRENCEIASRLFSAQPGVTVRYWCEAGRFAP